MAVDDDQIKQIKDQIKELSRNQVINLITAEDENNYISTLNRGLNNSSYTLKDDGPNALSSNQLIDLRETAFQRLLDLSEKNFHRLFENNDFQNKLREIIRIAPDSYDEIRNKLKALVEFRMCLSLDENTLSSINAISNKMANSCQSYLLERLIEKILGQAIPNQETADAFREIISAPGNALRDKLNTHQCYLGQPGDKVYNNSQIVNEIFLRNLFYALIKKLIGESISAMTNGDIDLLKNVLNCRNYDGIRGVLENHKNKFVKFGDVGNGILNDRNRVTDQLCMQFCQKALIQLLTLSFNQISYNNIDILEAVNEANDIESLKSTLHRHHQLDDIRLHFTGEIFTESVFNEIKNTADRRITDLKNTRLERFKNNRQTVANLVPAGQERDRLQTFLFNGGMTKQEMKEIAVTVTRKITRDDAATLDDGDVTEDLSVADKPTYKMELKKIAGGGALIRKQEGPHQATYALKNSTAESLYHKFLIIALAVKKECDIKGISIENEKIILSNIIPKDSFEAQEACKAAFRTGAGFKSVKCQQEPVSLNVQTLSGPSARP